MSRERMPLHAKILFGLVLPAAALVVAVALVLATGRGKRQAPAILFFASLVALPGLLLFNCWTMFVAWSSRVRLVLSAAALPAFFVLGALSFVPWHRPLAGGRHARTCAVHACPDAPHRVAGGRVARRSPGAATHREADGGKQGRRLTPHHHTFELHVPSSETPASCGCAPARDR